MLRKRSLLICVVAVAFCLVGIDSSEACYERYCSVDCYEDYYGNFWVCWFDCYNCCFWWDCLGDSGPSEETKSSSADSDFIVKIEETTSPMWPSFIVKGDSGTTEFKPADDGAGSL